MRGLELLVVCLACARSLQQPPAMESIAPPPQGTGAELLEAAAAAWARREDPAEAAAAEDLFLQAARAGPANPDSYAGAIRAKAFRLGHEKDHAERVRLAQSAVGVGQVCEENAPAAPLCDYWLAAALGLQARERTSTGHDALPHMVELLRRAARTDPSVDRGGPQRLLALVFMRAPGWPIGPGDVEAALPEAQAAARIAPDHPANLLALAEALQKNGRREEARAAYSEALRLANSPGIREDPDAAGWTEEARAALR